MKTTTKNLNAENPEEFHELSDSEKLKIETEIVPFLEPYSSSFSQGMTIAGLGGSKKSKKTKFRENYASDLKRNILIKKYLDYKSNIQKEVVYDDVLFEEKFSKNEHDQALSKLKERMSEESIAKMKKIGGKKAKQFLRLVMVRELMMQNERNIVV